MQTRDIDDSITISPDPDYSPIAPENEQSNDSPQAKRAVADPNQLDIFGNNPVTNVAPNRNDKNNENTESTKPRPNDDSLGWHHGDLFMDGLQTDSLQPGKTPGVDSGKAQAGIESGNAPGRSKGSGVVGVGDGLGGRGAGVLGRALGGGAGDDEGCVSGDLGQAGAGVPPAVVEHY